MTQYKASVKEASVLSPAGEKSGVPIAMRIAVTALLLSTLALGVWGIQRSLWLDEAWVANSVIAPSLSGMFYYPEWLQSTPPLFLLLMRAAAGLLGVSNAALRAVPLAFALIAVGAMIALTRRLLSPPFALLACAVLAFHPTVIEYSHTAKQYSPELAVSVVILLTTVLYLERPTRRRFCWLASLCILALPIAWSTVFLLPGVALAVGANGGWRRAAWLVLIFGGVLAGLYFAFIRQNVSPQLRMFWIATAQKPSPGLIAALIFCAGAAIRAFYKRAWIQIAALLPCLLLAAAGMMHLYPVEPRTRLFTLPGFLLAAAMIAQDVWSSLMRVLPRGRRFSRFASATLFLIAIAIGCEAVWRQIRHRQDRPQEDFQGAVRLLRQRVGPSDLLLVHASVLEGFRLYARMEGWRDHHAIFGSTGWPCCARDKIATPKSSDAHAVAADIDRMVPAGFTGRVWLFYSARPTHWVYIGNDEGNLWRNRLWDRGCPPTRVYLTLENVAISGMDCVHAK